eukprot:1324456-Pleurochrysis_carterae.AAC.1
MGSVTHQDRPPDTIIYLDTPSHSPSPPPADPQSAPVPAEPVPMTLPPSTANPPTIPPSDGQMDQPGPSRPEEIEPDPPMFVDGESEQDDAMEYAPIRPKIFFGEPDPSVRAKFRRPTRFTDP